TRRQRRVRCTQRQVNGRGRVLGWNMRFRSLRSCHRACRHHRVLTSRSMRVPSRHIRRVVSTSSGTLVVLGLAQGCVLYDTALIEQARGGSSLAGGASGEGTSGGGFPGAGGDGTGLGGML